MPLSIIGLNLNKNAIIKLPSPKDEDLEWYSARILNWMAFGNVISSAKSALRCLIVTILSFSMHVSQVPNTIPAGGEFLLRGLKVQPIILVTTGGLSFTSAAPLMLFSSHDLALGPIFHSLRIESQEIIQLRCH